MLALALVLSITQNSPAEELPLERFRAQLQRLGDSSAPLTETELERLEDDFGAAFELPAPWSFDFDPPPDAARTMGAARLRTTGECVFVCAHLVAPRNVRLRFFTTLDACYVSVSSVSFIDADGRTECSRLQFASQKNFFATSALPTVLSTLERELSALPLEGFEIAHVELESALPIGASPSVRCSLGARLEARVRRPVMCAVGEDLRTYGTLDGRALAVVGGAIETRYLR